MKTTFVTLILLNFLFAFTTFAQIQTEPEKTIEEFFKKYEGKNPSDALDYIFSTNKWLMESTDQINSVKEQLNKTVKILGRYSGYEVITKKSMGTSFILYSYMVKYERQPLRFSFKFYKADTKWSLYNFKYDDSLDEELDEASKAYRIMEK